MDATYHPGPRPRAFSYPFDEAAAVVAATEDLLAALDAVAELHLTAATHGRVGFAGATRQRFDRALDGTLDDLGRIRRLLRADLGALEDDVAVAERRAVAAEDEQRRWALAERWWRAGRPPSR